MLLGDRLVCEIGGVYLTATELTLESPKCCICELFDIVFSIRVLRFGLILLATSESFGVFVAALTLACIVLWLCPACYIARCCNVLRCY